MLEKVSVLHIIKSLGRGGAEILLPETLRMHDKGKYAFHYIYFLPWKDQVVKDIEGEGGKVTCVPASGNIGMLRKVGSVVNYIRRHDIRVIHCHLPWAGIVGRLAGWITGVPVVYTEHNKWERYHPVTYHLNKLSFRAQEKVIAVSKDVAASIRKHYKGGRPEVEVIPNGIDTCKFARTLLQGKDIRGELAIPAGAIVIGLSCVFRVQKRLDIWLEIANALRMRCDALYFIIVGDGVLGEAVRRKARELNLGGRLHFAGLQQDTRPYLRAMDIFMMTSAFEGLPIALLEAMGMGCLPACTAAGGIAEVVTDGVNGILVPVDEPMGLVEKIAACLSDAGAMDEMRCHARATVESNFGMQRMVDGLERVYETLSGCKHEDILISGS